MLPLGGGPDGEAHVLVPAGTVVSYNVSAMHRREDLYGADAQAFKPERWETIHPGWGFLPFNGGPRTCLGHKSNIADTDQPLSIYCEYTNSGKQLREQSS